MHKLHKVTILWHRQERDETIVQITHERDNQEQDDNCACRPKQGDDPCRLVIVYANLVISQKYANFEHENFLFIVTNEMIICYQCHYEQFMVETMQRGPHIFSKNFSVAVSRKESLIANPTDNALF
jgi:hypothetical protein